MPRRSRLNKSIQKKSRNTFFFSIIGIIVVLFLFFRYGIPFLSDASFLFGKVTNVPENTDQETEESVFVPVPRLDPLPSATNEKEIIVEGQTLSGLEIEIYLNGELKNTINADENGFFEDEIDLTEGDNILRVRAKKGKSTGEYTRSKTITFINEGPDLEVEFPATGAEIKNQNPIEVKGTTDPGSTVKVNDFQAIIKSDGRWNYFLTLRDGQNEIKIMATDQAGNETEKVISVQYSQ